MDRDGVGEFEDPGVVLEPLEPVGTTELAVRDEQWLKPWQWVVGLLPVLWVTWQTVEVVRVSRGKGMVVSHRQARRMHFLQLLAVVGAGFSMFVNASGRLRTSRTVVVFANAGVLVEPQVTLLVGPDVELVQGALTIVKVSGV